MDDTYDLTPADVVKVLTTQKNNAEVSLRNANTRKGWKASERAMTCAALQQEIKALNMAIQCVEIIANLGRVETLFPHAKTE